MGTTAVENVNGAQTFSLPYRSKLTEQIAPGQSLIIRGVTLDDAKRFAVGLHRDNPDYQGSDVPFQISVRFDEGKLVFNSFSKGNWGKEEKQKLAFKKGRPFYLRIRAHENKFIVYCDRKPVKEFEYRLPLQWINCLSIEGDAQVEHVQWGGKYYPVPYESGIVDGGLVSGKSLFITGIPDKKSKRFNINLMRRNGDIAFHFNPRFDEKHVIRNAQINGEWGKEEREGKMPFERHMVFDLQLKNEEYALQIFVNGDRFASFAHRGDPNDLVGLLIQGDVEINGIQIS